jgi:hypothetical protein
MEKEIRENGNLIPETLGGRTEMKTALENHHQLYAAFLKNFEEAIFFLEPRIDANLSNQ